MAASCEETKEADEAGLGLVDALGPFKVKLDLKAKKSSTTAAAEGSADASKCDEILMSLTHRDTFHTFEGLFSKEDLVKLKFNPFDPIENDMQLIQDAFYGAQSDITLESGFMNAEDETSELGHDYFDGAYLALKIKEVCRRHVREYLFVLKPKEVSAFERQSKVNAALRETVEDLSATVATMKTEHSREMGEIKALLTQEKATHSQEITEMKAMQTQENAEMKEAHSQEIAGLKEEIGAKLDKELRTLKARMTSLLTQRTVTFFERITTATARTGGKWSNIALNCGQFGYESAERCSFARLVLATGCVEITADGDYELSANCAVGYCNTFGMQLVVRDTDGNKRLLDAVGGGIHGGSSITSICRVDGVWLPISAGSTITMRLYVSHSGTNNAYTDSSLFSEMKDKSMPVSSVSIRKLC